MNLAVDSEAFGYLSDIFGPLFSSLKFISMGGIVGITGKLTTIFTMLSGILVWVGYCGYCRKHNSYSNGLIAIGISMAVMGYFSSLGWMDVIS